MPTSPLESALTSSCAIFRISLKTRHFNSIRINSYVFPRLKSFRISTYIKTPGGGGQQTPELSHAERANLLHSRHARSPQSRNRRPRLAPAGSWPENPWLPHGASCRGPCGAARVSRSRRFIHALLSCNSGGHFSRLGPSRETRAHGPEAHRRHRQHLFQRIALARPTRSAPLGRLLRSGKIRRLHKAVVSVLKRALECCRNPSPDFRDPEWWFAGLDRILAVYGRKSEPCRRCGCLPAGTATFAASRRRAVRLIIVRRAKNSAPSRES